MELGYSSRVGHVLEKGRRIRRAGAKLRNKKHEKHKKKRRKPDLTARGNSKQKTSRRRAMHLN